MKILITGTHSTGKTTLISEFVKRNNQLKIHVINEVAREMMDNGFLLGKKGNVNSYIHYIKKQLEKEIQSDSFKYDILLADRSLIDGVVHPIINNRLNSSDVPQDFIDMFERILYFQKTFYDIYVYIPIEFGMINDKNRPIDENYRREIDKELKSMLDKHISNYCTVSGTIEERINKLYEVIKEESKLKNNIK